MAENRKDDSAKDREEGIFALQGIKNASSPRRSLSSDCRALKNAQLIVFHEALHTHFKRGLIPRLVPQKKNSKQKKKTIGGLPNLLLSVSDSGIPVEFCRKIQLKQCFLIARARPVILTQNDACLACARSKTCATESKVLRKRRIKSVTSKVPPLVGNGGPGF